MKRLLILTLLLFIFNLCAPTVLEKKIAPRSSAGSGTQPIAEPTTADLSAQPTSGGTAQTDDAFETYLVGVVAAVLNVCSMSLFFAALDRLAAAHAVGLGSPLAISASLVGFTLYSWFYLREKREPAALAGLLCICAGAVAASF